MDTHTIKMPDIGEGIAEVEIVEWHVGVGDTVAEDQVLADVMTDKASVEIPSPIAGSVMALGGQVGDVLAVGAELITLRPARADATPSAEPAVVASETKTSHTKVKKVLASPSVRQRARSLDIDLSQLFASAGDSPISHGDLDQYLLSRSPSDRVAPSGSHVPQAAFDTKQAASAKDLSSVEMPDETHINVVGIRRQIANKMLESKRQIPHFTYVEEVDITELEQLRKTLNQEPEAQSERLTLLPFIVRAMILAVRRFPEINARYDTEKGVITQFGAVHMGIATQTDNGLMVPVIRDAQRLDLWECATQISRLATMTRLGKAQRSDLSGSTLTLSSLGPLGGVVSTPIINHPEVAIVGVNRIVERPVFQNDQLVARKLMNLSSSFDHRVVDGMNAAQFIQEIRRLLESPVLLFVR